MEPIINIEENIGKTVGRRTRTMDSFAYGMGLQKAGGQFVKTFRLKGIPRGVFRFHSHEEANAWLIYHQTRKTKS
jgi:hypothetical protein